jgi:uracil-DNA glycosylase family protein
VKRRIAVPPNSGSIKATRKAARSCLVCPFAKKSTQTVFGEGPEHPLLMIVGEVPGDAEDLAGHPFVGPAGKLLRQIFTELEIDPEKVYVTNAVKHFKFVKSGKRRLHQKPNAGDIHACQPWLLKEMQLLKPKVILALGATAAATLCDRPVTINSARTRWVTARINQIPLLVSWHPSAILRSPDPNARLVKRNELKADLKNAWKKSLT